MEFGAGALLFAGGLPPRALPSCLDLREGMLAYAALPRFEATPVGGFWVTSAPPAAARGTRKGLTAKIATTRPVSPTPRTPGVERKSVGGERLERGRR